jgi:hypothetical protein
MTGVDVIGELLRGYGGLTAVVPLARIKDGPLPLNSTLPSISVEHISGTDRGVLKRGALNRVTDRVQVTVATANIRDRKLIIRLVRRACSDRQGDFAGVTEVDVQTEGQGPDFMDDVASIFMRTQDFMVSYNELN